MAASRPIVVGLDAGTSKVCVVVADVARDHVEVLGIGTAPSKGIQKGAVVNIDATVEAIHKAVEEAEVQAGCAIRDVVVALGGSHLRSFNSHGVVAVKNGEVAPADVERVMDAARAVVLPMDAPRTGLPWLIETCPASTLKHAGLYPSYKGRSSAARAARRGIVDGLVRRGWLAPLSPGLRRLALDNTGGDALDSMIAAMAIGRAYAAGEFTRTSSDGAEAIEGRVYY